MKTTKVPTGIRKGGKRRDAKDIDGQMVKLNTAIVKLSKAVVVYKKDGSQKQIVFNISKSDIKDSMKMFPRIGHMNMTTFVCASVYNSTYGDNPPSGEDDDLVFLALMSAYTSSLDFDKPIDVSTYEYVRYKTDILRYLILISQ